MHQLATAHPDSSALDDARLPHGEPFLRVIHLRLDLDLSIKLLYYAFAALKKIGPTLSHALTN
jgi:hypothetical protein